MKYKEAAAYKKTIEQKGMVFGLDTIKSLLQVLDNPQDKLRCIHVAGTNGKGSVIAYLSEILVRAGYRTGAYTSPAVFHPLEIYCVNGRRMEENVYGALMEQIRPAVETLHEKEIYPTAFEIDTAIGFLYFLQEKCDVVLLETGLGGELDATNCIKHTECAVFASISMDHMAVLGNRIEEIAEQKAGIIKEGCAVVSGIQTKEVLEVLQKACADKHAQLAVVDESALHREPVDGMGHYRVRYGQFQEMIPGICGKYQAENAAIVLEVVEKLRQKQYNISMESVIEGIQHTQWMGRLTQVRQNPLVLIDGAHNEQAVCQLCKELGENWKGRRWIFVMGVLADKDYDSMAALIAHKAEKILTITPDNPRALPKEELAKVLSRAGATAEASGSLRQALQEAFMWCGEEDKGVLVFGSFTFLREAVQEIQDAMPLVDRLASHPLFQQKMAQIEELERDRIFCRHGWEHCMAVARSCALLNEERGLGFSKEMLYALALVHDLGRAEQYLHQIPHEEAGAEIAGQILPDCGFGEEEVEQMLFAIRSHRQEEQERNELAGLLVEADKKTRLCFACHARDACKWPVWKRNLTIRL